MSDETGRIPNTNVQLDGLVGDETQTESAVAHPARRDRAPRPVPHVLAIEPYVGGAPGIAGRVTRAKLNSNEGPFGIPPGAAAAIGELTSRLHRYPDGGCRALRDAIGRTYGLDPTRLVCSAGSDEIISYLCHLYGGIGTELIMSTHSFYEYGRAGTLHGCTIVRVPERGAADSSDFRADVDGILAAVTPATRLVFLANPDNPTGSFLPFAEILRLRQGLEARRNGEGDQDILLVLDAAYTEFATRTDHNAGERLVECGDNTVMLRTFSKIWGAAGLRLGWAYGPPGVVEALNRVRHPFNVSILAQAAAVAALNEPGWLARCVEHNTRQRARLAERLGAAGLRVYPSEANFLLIGFGSPECAHAADQFLQDHGVLLRAMVMYKLPHTLRVTIGTEEECTLVADTLDAFVAQESA